jgi:4-amino-4-deoxy-L-arabinose transferase-like glycosyltransferase
MRSLTQAPSIDDRPAGRLARWWASGMALPVLIAVIDFVAHMAFANNYGYFRDELYYIAAGQHLAFGYVDFPPMIALLAAAMHVISGDNLIALHVVSALVGSLLVVVGGMLARELGGGRFAQFLSALGTSAVIVFMATGSIFSMDILDALWWSLLALVLIRILRTGDKRLWLLFGLIAGVALTTKVTVLFFGFTLTIGLLLTPSRAHFRSRWPYLGGVIALAFLLPYLIWNAVHGWPTIEFWQNYGGDGGGPLGFLANQILSANPPTLLLTIAGLVFYLKRPEGRPYRALGWAFVVLYLLMTVMNVKPYYFTPIYPMMFAGGALLFERIAAKPRRSWLRPALTVLFALSAILLAPLAMPILSPAHFDGTYSYLAGTGNGAAGQDTSNVFPQYLGDRFGWPELSATMRQAYQALPPDEQTKACIFTQNYGEASAFNFFAKDYGLPPAISGHNNYFIWGPGSCSGAVVLTIGLSRDDVAQSYNRVEQVATTSCGYCVPEENDQPVFLGTEPKFGALKDAWKTTKHFN